MATPNLPDDQNDANIEDVCSWIDSMAKRGELPHTSAQQKISALRSITSILGEDEPKDARSVLNTLPDITLRWATKNPTFKGTTVQTYESKARAAIESYFEWKRDPKGFKFERHTSAPRGERVKSNDEKAAPGSGRVPPAANDTRRTFRYPLPNGREFAYEMPTDGLSVAEVRRIGMHLLTLATDWQPGAASTSGESFAVVRPD
jgi:hypothetical protein